MTRTQSVKSFLSTTKVINPKKEIFIIPPERRPIKQQKIENKTIPPKPKKIDMTPEEHNDYIKNEIKTADIFPHEVPEIKVHVGKLKLMEPRNYALHHEVTPLVNDYATNGCPVNCGPDWSLEHIQALLQRGPHRSSTSKAAIKQFNDETIEKYNTVMPEL